MTPIGAPTIMTGSIRPVLEDFFTEKPGMPRFDRLPDGRAWIASVLVFWSFAAGFAAAIESGAQRR